ncbi:minor capsid protein [Capybara microvirus Cap3_SP_541]|nr:minor capsid protein [Capybara microvirus Cap3_SP_541]
MSLESALIPLRLLSGHSANTSFSDPGSPIKQLYHGKYDDNGRLTLVPDGEINLQEQIDSFRDQCDMDYIIRQLLQGNESVLSSRQSLGYIDTTEYPSSMAALLQLRIDAESIFYSLPLDERQHFDNSFDVWFAQTGSPDWLKSISSSVSSSDPAAPAAPAEVISNES